MKVIIFFVLALGFALNAADQRVPVEVRSIPAPADGFWTAISTARDGSIYIGLCKHGGSARVVRYDPKLDRMTVLGSMAEVTGEMWLGKEPQAKVHVPLQEAQDGKLYFATHLGNFWYHARETERDAFPGGHWFVYDPKSSKVTDLGLAAENQGVISMVLDPKRNVIYGMTFPRGHLIEYSIAAKRTRDLGRIANWDMIVRTPVLDGKGRLFGSTAPNRVFRYDPETGRVELLPQPLPHREGIPAARWGTTTGKAIWRAAFYHEQRKKIYGIQAGGVDLFELDPETGDGRLLSPMCPESFVGKTELPYASMALALGRDDVLYYAAQGGASRFDYSGTEGASETGPRAFLVTYDLKSGVRKDNGMIAGTNGEVVLGSEGAAAGKDGTIYFVGQVQKPGKPPEIAMFFYRPENRRASR